MAKVLLVTGASSPINSASILKAIRVLWRASEKVRIILSDYPDIHGQTARKLEVLKEKILAIRQDAIVDIRMLDLSSGDVSILHEGVESVRWLFLGAATGMKPGMDPKVVEMVNNLSQVMLAQQVLAKHRECTVVYINSLLGHNTNLPLLHPSYQPVQVTKHGAELALRNIERTLDTSRQRINIVVASLVGETFANVSFRRSLRGEYEESVKQLPDGQVVSIDEVSGCIVEALSSKASGKTWFAPKSAGDHGFEELLTISRR